MEIFCNKSAKNIGTCQNLTSETTALGFCFWHSLGSFELLKVLSGGSAFFFFAQNSENLSKTASWSGMLFTCSVLLRNFTQNV